MSSSVYHPLHSERLQQIQELSSQLLRFSIDNPLRSRGSTCIKFWLTIRNERINTIESMGASGPLKTKTVQKVNGVELSLVKNNKVDRGMINVSDWVYLHRRFGYSGMLSPIAATFASPCSCKCKVTSFNSFSTVSQTPLNCVCTVPATCP